MSVVSADNFREFWDIDAANAGGSLLQRVIDAAQERCEAWCGGRKFELADYTEYHDIPTNTQAFVYVKHPPLNSVTSLTDDAQDSGGGSTVSSTDYNTDADKGRIYLQASESYFTRGPLALKVVYSGGWAENDVPSAVWFGCMMEAGNLWINAPDRLGKSAEAADGQSVTWAEGDICPEAANLLRPYKKYL